MRKLQYPFFIIFQILWQTCSLIQSQEITFEEGYYHVSAPMNSTIEIRCDKAEYYAADLLKHNNVSNLEECFSDIDGQLTIRLSIQKDFISNNNYTCENKKQKLLPIRIIINDESETVLLRERRTGLEKKRKKCEANNSVTLAWKKNGEVICEQCFDELPPLQLGFVPYAPVLCVIFIILLVLAVFMIGFIYVRRRSNEIRQLCKLYEGLTTNECTKNLDPSSNVPLRQLVDELPYDLSYEIRVNRLKIKKVISEGNYGRIYAGELRSKPPRKEFLKVVVKVPKRPAKYADSKALSDELKILMAIDLHPNIICLIGVITENLRRGGDMCGIFEETDCILKTFLRERRNHFINELHDFKNPVSDSSYSNETKDTNLAYANKNFGAPITTSFLNLVAYQVANGMEYLARKKCIHCDLAARNILMSRNRTIRIAGLGQDRQWEVGFWMRSIQYSSPFKNMARESIKTSQFTEKSDVWSYGILLWETFSLGDDPFKGFETPQKLEEFYAKGNRLAQPDYMPSSVSRLMYECWEEVPNKRPNFAICKETMAEIVKQDSFERYEMLHNQLNEQLVQMQRYSEWRDGPSHDMIRRRRKASQFSRTA